MMDSSTVTRMNSDLFGTQNLDRSQSLPSNDKNNYPSKKLILNNGTASATKETKKLYNYSIGKKHESRAPNWHDLDRIGVQLGSIPGGEYIDKTTAKKYYIKEPYSEDLARNEVLANKLYEAAGVLVPKVHLLENDKIASEFIDDLAIDKELLKSDNVSGVRDNFVVDAWLANWDVVGLDYDNLLIRNDNSVIRIDMGGALRYRALGSPKGSLFGKNVDETSSLLDPLVNKQSTAIFENISRKELLVGATKVLNISSDKIHELVTKYGPKDQDVRIELIDILIARQQDIKRQYPDAL